MTSKKIVDKFIPKTNSHTTSRIKDIVKDIKTKERQQKNKKKRTGIKTYKQKYQAQLLHKSKTKTKTKTQLQSNKKHIKNISNIVIPNMEPLNKLETHNITTHNTTTNTTTKTTITNTITNTDKYIIAIPSYNRPELIQVKTLALLNKHNINPKLINIFVSDREQYDLYKSKLPNSLYNKLIIGVKGLKNQRNYINNYYPEGYHIVEMDDDIDKIVQLVIKKHSTRKGSSKGSSKVSMKGSSKPSKSLKPIENLDEFIKQAFKRCISNGIFLWGVYPLANSHFMTDTITTDLRFIVGPMWGMINRHRPDLQLTVDEKENSERTLQHWVIDGSVLRFNNIGIETKYYKNKGGMQNEGKNRKEEALKSVHYLHKQYPKLTKIHLGKKSGVPEIKLIKQK